MRAADEGEVMVMKRGGSVVVSVVEVGLVRVWWAWGGCVGALAVWLVWVGGDGSCCGAVLLRVMRTNANNLKHTEMN